MKAAHSMEGERMKQLRVNWILTFLLGAHMSVSYIMFFPTLHNFIVNSPDCENPGLGGTELDYTLATSALNLGGFIGGASAIIFAKFISYKIFMIIIPTLNMVGSVLYGASVSSWMVILGRFFSGASGICVLLAFIWYYVSSIEEYNTLQKKLGKLENPKLKRTLTVIFSVVTTFTYVPVSGLLAMVALFPVDQFRWPAWFNVAFSAVTVVCMLLFFKDSTVPLGNWKLSKEKVTSVINWKSFSFISFLLIFLLTFSGSVVDSSLKVLEIVTSPILSDYFGFDVARITYFTFGLTALFPISCLLLLLLERFRVSSRVVFFIAMIMNTFGLILMSDWQFVINSSGICSNFTVVSHEKILSGCVNEG